ncbi:MAG: N-acetylmuramoyl-L-alanine amidase [Acidimicrobiia bacterium]
MLRRILLVIPTLGSLLGLTLVVLPVVKIASPAPGPVRISSLAVTSPNEVVASGWSKTVPGNANLVGVRWKGDPSTTFTIETRDQAGRWSIGPAVGIPDGGPDPGSPEARRRRPGNVSDPVWVGDAKAVRIRVAKGSARAVDVERVQVPRASSPTGIAGAAAPQPGIITRAQWGADESLRLANCPEGPDNDSRVVLAIVHHTGGNNNYGPGDSPAIMRGLYAYATQTLQYCDMHYNFLVDRYGQVFEGRFGGIAAAVHGAHSVGFNTNTTGIATIGNFQIAPAPPVMVAALERLIAWKFDVHGVDPTRPLTYVTISGNDKFAPGTAMTVPPVIGHQDTWFTDCPGQFLEPLLPKIRQAAGTIMAANRTWGGWNPEGVTLPGVSAVASWAPNRLDVFATDSGGSLVRKAWDGQAWSPGWENLAHPRTGPLASAPAAVSWGPNRLDVFATAPDKSLIHLWWNGVRWSQWENLGGQLSSAPTVSTWGPNRLDVFARAPSGALQHMFYDGRWSSWETLGGDVVGAPAAVAWGPGRINVFVRGTDNRLHHQWYGGRWVGWESLGGTLTAAPTAASWGPDRIDVFVRGADKATWHRWWDGARWQGFESLGGVLTTSPTAISKSWNHIDIFVRGTDRQLWRRTWG